MQSELIGLGYLKRRKRDRALQLLKMPDDADDRMSTVSVPLVGSAPCGAPLLASGVRWITRIDMRSGAPARVRSGARKSEAANCSSADRH
jgi:hypothetical protein